MKKNNSIVKKLVDIQTGTIDKRVETNQTLKEILIGTSFFTSWVPTQTYEFILNKSLSSLEWHPKQNSIIIGSRGGDVAYVDINSQSVRQCIRGGGRGQQITAIKFDLLDNNWFYTSSTSGKLIKRRIDGSEDIILKDTYSSDELNYSRFSCLDLCSDHKLLISGDSKGLIHCLPSTESPKKCIQVIQIHDSNILNCEFNKFNSNEFITASLDSTAKLWDIRMFSNKCRKPVLTFRHSEPLNSATFSPTDGSTLLVSDHIDQIKVYRGPDWQLERQIRHSHQQTQRFCLLKPQWHPFHDLFIIGSFSLNPLVSGQYLDKPQTIDIIDAKKGVILSRISDGHSGVITMSSFNCCGDIIAGFRGWDLLIFQSKTKN